MLPEIQNETSRQVLIVLGVIIANTLLSNVIWRLVGSRRRRVRVFARVSAAFLGILNLGLAVVSLFRMLRYGPEWMYILLLVVSTIFAYRVGGATRGQYP